jgi:hypothetical protein
MARFFCIAILGLVLLGPTGESVQGEDITLAQAYGRGVQAYFNGEYERAHALLSQAIALETPDPRCHYYRGLANTKLGKAEDATADFKKGAKLETLDVGGNYPVSKDLIRIQGQVRLEIEASRRQARIDMKALQQERQRVRYEQNKLRTEVVKRKEFNEGSGAKPLVDLPALPADATRNITNPFDIPTEKLGSSDLLGGQNSRPSAVDPTASQPVASTGNDPFAKPTVAIPNDNANPAGAANPFTNKPAAGDDAADPFAVKPAAGGDAADPFAVKPAAGGDVADPFAVKPAAGGDVADPFAPPKPAAGDAPKKGIFGSLFRAVGAGVSKAIGGDEAGDGAAPKPDDAPAKPVDPFGAAPKPDDAPAKPDDPFGAARKPDADPFGGNDPFKP